MIVLRYAAAVPPTERPTVAAYGRFATLHRGHQELLRSTRAEADRAGARCLVVAGVHTAGTACLASTRQRLRGCAELGVDVLLLARGAAGPVDWALLRRLGVVALVSADPTSPPAGEKIRLRRIDAVEHDGERVDDAAVRAALDAADLLRVRALLGRPYAIDGRVVHGFHRGAPLGIPTANLRVRDRHLPPDGVYAVRADVRGRLVGGVANIGLKPTFGDGERSVETHLLDFAADLYGERLEIALVRRIRAEQKFASVDDLLAQIRRDIAAARQILAQP